MTECTEPDSESIYTHRLTQNAIHLTGIKHFPVNDCVFPVRQLSLNKQWNSELVPEFLMKFMSKFFSVTIALGLTGIASLTGLQNGLVTAMVYAYMFFRKCVT